MDTGEGPGFPDLAGAQGAAPRRDPVDQADPAAAGLAAAPSRPAAARWWAAAGWIAGAVVLLAFAVRIALTYPVNSDGANSALQAWDMLHGNYLLHNWVIGDATYYTFDLPVTAVTEAFLGLHTVTCQVASALIYATVVACAVVLAIRDSHGAARAARGAVVVAVMAAPLASNGTLVGQPDHTGTSAIILASFLLIDLFPARRFTPPLLCAVLCAGQIGDATVRYVAVPAILAVSVYRVLAARKIRLGDSAIAVAALVSLPVATAVRAVMLRHGAYAMIAPNTKLSPAAQVAHHTALALHAILVLYGGIVTSHSVLGGAGAAFGVACVLAAVFGLLRVVWTWRTASRGEQLVCLAIVFNVAAYVFSTVPVPNNFFEIVAIVPCGAVLAARGLVPARIAGRLSARAAVAAAVIAALVPLAAAAAAPTAPQRTAPLVAWLEAHGLRYGVGWYWDASLVTVQSSGQVQIAALTTLRQGAAAYDWETNVTWYDASRHDASFVVTPMSQHQRYFTQALYEDFGRPIATYRVTGLLVLVYRKNLLKQVIPALPLQQAISRGQAGLAQAPARLGLRASPRW